MPSRSPSTSAEDETLEDLFPPSSEVDAVAAGLRDLGASPGDVVMWQRPNGPEVEILYRACWRIRAVPAPLHHRFGDSERQALAFAAGARVVLAPSDALPSGDPSSLGRPSSSPADLAVVLFTSGSTGDPKGVKHTHRSLLYKTRQMVGVHGLSATDAVLMPAPLAHISGLLNGILVPAAAGMAAVLMPRWDPDEAVRIIRTAGITFMVGPPVFFSDLAAAGLGPDSPLRLVSCGGTGVTPELCRETASRLGCVVKRTYGSTEAPTVACTPAPYHRSERCCTTDGKALAEMRLAPDGELLVRGPELFAGYLDERQTAEAMSDDWYRTGDIAEIEDGWVRIAGRKKEIIIRGGENIAVAEVEALLLAHPDIRQAAVVGFPDDRLGERVAAYVVTREPFDLESCRQWFEELRVAPYKTPERVVRVDHLPLLEAGKIDRSALRELARRSQT